MGVGVGVGEGEGVADVAGVGDGVGVVSPGCCIIKKAPAIAAISSMTALTISNSFFDECLGGGGTGVSGTEGSTVAVGSEELGVGVVGAGLSNIQ